MVSVDTEFAVEIVYALPERQTLVALTVHSGTTVREAVLLAGLPLTYPEIDVTSGSFAMVGIFGKRVPPDTLLKQGDRVEIYRLLTVDPKAARRRRAAKRR